MDSKAWQARLPETFVLRGGPGDFLGKPVVWPDLILRRIPNDLPGRYHADLTEGIRAAGFGKYLVREPPLPRRLTLRERLCRLLKLS
jgi:hypothetical protein